MSEEKVSEGTEYILEGPGRPQPPDEPLADVVFAALVQHADSDTVAQIDPSSGAELKFSELLAESVRVAEGLRSQRLGLGPGHVVLVCCNHVSDLYPGVLGAVFAGISVLPVDAASSPGDIRTFISLCKPRALYAEPRTLARVHTALQGLARQPPVIVLNQDDVPARLVRAGDIAFADLVQAVPTASPASFAPPPLPSLDGHVPLILPTAASSNKAAMLSNKRALVLLDLFREVVPDAVAAAAPDVVLASLPLSQSAGMLSLLRCCWAGHTRVFMAEQDPQPLQVLAVLEKYRVTRWVATPGSVQAVSAHAATPKFNLTALGTAVVCGEGESMSAAAQGQAREALGARIQPMYCVTEVGLLLLSKDGMPGSVGTVCPTVSLKVVDSISGESLGPGEEGELRAKSKSALKGYVGDPEGTAAMFDDEGWFCTGDVMRYDADGHFFFVEKLNDSINCAGSSVSARELEEVIRRHPAVRDVAVLGRPDPDHGELPMAFVVVESEATVTKQDIINLVKDKLPEGKQLRGGVEFLDSMPRSTSGKLSSRQLRDRMPRRSVVGSLLQM